MNSSEGGATTRVADLHKRAPSEVDAERETVDENCTERPREDNARKPEEEWTMIDDVHTLCVTATRAHKELPYALFVLRDDCKQEHSRERDGRNK